jgi:hypothetical protein
VTLLCKNRTLSLEEASRPDDLLRVRRKKLHGHLRALVVTLPEISVWFTHRLLAILSPPPPVVFTLFTSPA